MSAGAHDACTDFRVSHPIAARFVANFENQRCTGKHMKQVRSGIGILIYRGAAQLMGMANPPHETQEGAMKFITSLTAAAAVCALAAGAQAGEPQRGIKMLITAASHHHESGSGPTPASPTAGGQTGIDKLIAAATASRHLPPVGVGPHAFRDAASEGEARNPVDIVVPHPGTGENPASGAVVRNVRPLGAGPIAPLGAAGRLSRLGPTGVQAPVRGPGSAPMPADTAFEGNRGLQRLSPVFVRPPAQNGAVITGTAVGRPNLSSIGGVGARGHQTAGISGTGFRPRR